jgi:hypothetical protein
VATAMHAPATLPPTAAADDSPSLLSFDLETFSLLAGVHSGMELEVSEKFRIAQLLVRRFRRTHASLIQVLLY